MSQAESNVRDMGLGLPGMVPMSLLEPKDLDELAARGAIVHTSVKNQDQLNECIREWNKKGLKVLVQAVTYPLIQKERLMKEVSSLFYGNLPSQV